MKKNCGLARRGIDSLPARIDYLIRLRIQKATELLADGELRIGEVVLACGFNDSNYFTRQFWRVTGRSPREYRKAG